MPVSVSFVLPEPEGRNVANLTDAPRPGRVQGGALGIKEPGQGNRSRPRVAHREFLSGRADRTWCATQLQLTRMIPPPQNRAGYAIKGCLSSRRKAWRAPRRYARSAPRYCAFPGFSFLDRLRRAVQSGNATATPSRFPGSTGVPSDPGSEELPHHTGDRGHVEGPQLRRRGNRGRHPRAARRQRRDRAEDCRSAHPPASHRQSPSGRYEVICQSPFRYRPAALRSAFRRR